MKPLLDEKGRLFGKINLIDFMVIVFLISLTPMLYYGYRILTAKKKPYEEKFHRYWLVDRVSNQEWKVSRDYFEIIHHYEIVAMKNPTITEMFKHDLRKIKEKEK